MYFDRVTVKKMSWNVPTDVVKLGLMFDIKILVQYRSKVGN